MHLQTVAAPFSQPVVWLALGTVGLAIMLVCYRYGVLKRASERAAWKARQRMRETDEVTDQLLQGVSGLLLTFHVAAQRIGEGHAARKLMEHALAEADDLVSSGRRRFEQVVFRAGTEEEHAVQSFRKPQKKGDGW